MLDFKVIWFYVKEEWVIGNLIIFLLEKIDYKEK